MWTHVPFDAPPCIEAEWRHAALSVGALDDVIHVAQRLAPRWHPAADVPLLLSLLLGSARRGKNFARFATMFIQCASDPAVLCVLYCARASRLRCPVPRPLTSPLTLFSHTTCRVVVSQPGNVRSAPRRTTRWRTSTIRRCRRKASRCTRALRSSRCAPRASHAHARFPEVLGGQLTLRRLNQMRMHVLAFMKC